MKKILTLFAVITVGSLWAETETVNGYTWTFTVTNGFARIGAIDDFGDAARAVDPVPTGTLEIPSVLGGAPVKTIGPRVLGWDTSNLTKLVVPENVETIEGGAFYGSSVKVFVLPSSLKTIKGQAFDLIDELETLVIPENVGVFEGGLGQCRNLRSLYFKGNAPAECSSGLGARLSMTTYVMPGSMGWKDAGSSELPEQWNDRPIKVWESAPDIKKTITFSPDGGTGGGEYAYDFGTEIGELPSAMREGYTFAGWYNGEEKITESTIVTGDIECHATWVPNSYSVTFDANGGCGGTSVEALFGESIVAPTVTRYGYSLVGWSPEVPASVPASNVTYIAQWQLSGYRVTFVSGNNYDWEEVAAIGDSVWLPNPREVEGAWRAGHVFEGWHTEGGVLVNNNKMTGGYTPQGNITLYAHWRVDTKREIMIDGVTWGYDDAVGNDGVEVLYVNGEVPADFSIPETIGGECVVAIGVDAFSGREELRRAIIPNGIRVIGECAFSDSHLREVVISNGTQRIEAGAFEYCSWLRCVTIPSSVAEIGENAFDGCERLSTIYVENGDIDRIRTLLAGTGDYLDWDWDVEFATIGDAEGSAPSPAPTEVTNVVERIVYVTNVVEVMHHVTNVVEKIVEIPIATEAGKVSEGVVEYVPDEGFDGSQKQVFNGIAVDGAGTFAGLVQITTGKAGAKGVKVGGFIMLANGKKNLLKSITVPVGENGKVRFVSTVKNLGDADIEIGSDGFAGRVDGYALVSGEGGESVGILSGSLTLTQIDGNSKLKKKKVAVSSAVFDNTAKGTAAPKGDEVKVFAAEFE